MTDTLTRPVFPFTALVGQVRMKRALVLNAVNPKLGGVLIRGEKGTAKSTAVRGLANLLPEITAILDCPFGCDPDDPGACCESCRERPEPPTIRRKVPLVELPVGATEDRVVGTLDLEQAIQEGRRRFEPGLLASANRGILYIDEVNLLNDHLVDVLLDAAAMGVNYVEREGVSVQHPAQFILVGTMNPEEGDLRPQLLDRFALAVEVEGLDDPALRAEVVRRRIGFEGDPPGFLSDWRQEEQAERLRINRAQDLLPEVRLDERMLRLITQLCVDFEVDGLRADIVMYRTALTLAAYAGRRVVDEGDVRDAAELALLHRRRRLPFQQPQLDREQLEQKIREHLDEQDDPDPGDDPPPDDGPTAPPPAGGEPEERVFESGQQYAVRPLAAPSDRRLHQEYRGRRSKARGRTFAGHYVAAEIPRERARDLALDATLRAAAPYQLARRARERESVRAREGSASSSGRGRRSGAEPGEGVSLPLGEAGEAQQSRVRALPSLQSLPMVRPPPKHPHPDPLPRGEGVSLAPDLLRGSPHSGALARSLALLLEPWDLRQKVRETKMGNLIVFVVDASGSMAARDRMVAAKGAVLSLLLDAYQKRDQVGLVAFRGRGAELLLPPTNSVDLARACLESLPTGGRTPLGHGLQLGLATIERYQRQGRETLPLLVLVSDGRANVPLQGGDPFDELWTLGVELARRRVHTVVVDAEGGRARLEFATEVAHALGASYLPIDQLAAGSLAGAARQGASLAWQRWGRA